MNKYKFSADKNLADTIKSYYNFENIKNNNQIYFQGKLNNGIKITSFIKKDGTYTLFFEGESNVIDEVNKFTNEATQVSNENKWLVTTSQIGSDEVGVGDFFGPVVVVATYLTSEDMKLIDKYDIKDSKKMSDQRIFNIGSEIITKFKYKHIYCNPSKISSLEKSGWSMHKILTNLHNLCHKKLIEEYNLSPLIPVFVDQFDSSKVYFNYCNDIIDNPLTFKTKGESYYPSVAISSVIARYYFLTYWEELEKKLKMPIPKGASSEVDKVYKKLKEDKNSNVELYVKQHFRNFND